MLVSKSFDKLINKRIANDLCEYLYIDDRYTYVICAHTDILFRRSTTARKSFESAFSFDDDEYLFFIDDVVLLFFSGGGGRVAILIEIQSKIMFTNIVFLRFFFFLKNAISSCYLPSHTPRLF